jgi:parallel beta-helix repeat protein
MFSPTNIRGFTVHDLTIDGNAANNTQISAGIVATGCWRFRFYNAAIINTTSVSSVYGWGVYLTAGKDGEHGTSSSIHDCDFTSVPGGGVVVMDTTKNVSVRRCSFHQCANGAIAIGGGGLNPGDCTGCEVSNCTVVGPGGGIGIGTYRHPGFMVDSCQYCNIIDNVVSETGYYGIAIQSQYCNVTGNTVLHCSLLFAGGAGVLFNADHSNFTGNTIANCQGGIDAGGAQNSLISGNNIGDSWGTAGVGSGYGMNLGASNNNIIANNVFNNNAGRSGNDYGAELGIHPYDGGGDMPAFPFVGANNQVIGNTFNLVSSHAWGISCSDLPNGVVITDNVFNGGAESFLISAPCQSVVIKNNVWTGAMRGTSVAAAPMVVFPDYADTILLTGAQASISQIMTNGQQANYGRFTHAAITNGGNYSTPPTLTITGTGTGSGAAANAMLNGPAPTAVGGIAITNMGVGVYTSLTITPSSGALTTVAYVGAGNATVGREITIVNTSGNNQILVNNTFLQLSGGANLILAPNASIRLRGTGSDASGYPVFTEMSARPAINLAAPGAIGGTTPAPGTFTDVTANNAFTVYGVSRFPNANVSIGSGSANPGLTVNGGGSGANDGPMLILQWNGVTRGGLGGYSAFSGGGYDPRTMLAGYDGLLFSTQNVIAGGIDTSFNLYANGAVRCGGATGPSWTTGSAVPSSVQPVGSLYSRVSTWSAGATLYVSKGAGAWTAVASV